MANDGKHNPTTSPLYGLDPYLQLPDMIEREFETGGVDLTHLPIEITGAIGTFPIVATVAGKSVEIYELVLWFNGPNDVQLLNGVAHLTGVMQGNVKGGSQTFAKSKTPHFKTAVGSAFNISLSTASGVSGYVKYLLTNI